MSFDVSPVINGETRPMVLAEMPTVAGVLAALELKADRVAVEHNGRIVRRSEWERVPVASGDKLEVVHFVGGGWA